MKEKTILYVLTDYWCEWEGSYAVDILNTFYEEFVVKTISIGKKSKRGMSGILSKVDLDINTFDNWDDVSLVIMPGGIGWVQNEYPEIKEFVSKVIEKKIPLCAICNATTFLARNGFLDNIKHTGDSKEWMMKQTEYGYRGIDNYLEKQVVYDGGILTANETAAIEFTYEIMNILKVDTKRDRDNWYNEFELCRGKLKRISK